MSERGFVHLVGAGPGDPGLLTLRGRQCLEQADVVVYDYLANPELLVHAPDEAERIYVGKKAGAHTLKQEGINALLVKHGRAGRRVVRLKGGDPFIFGRGGEEALALRQAGVPFDVVPGITAGVAAAAYAGIPVTHRGLNSVLTFVTGNEDPEKDESAIDWDALARGGGTLAFYMGVGNLPGIARRLVLGGRSPDTPVALVRHGTRPVQEVIRGTLADIAERVAAAGLKPPAITIVGEVVDLRDHLRWFDTAPLFGRTLAVTRSRTQASALAGGLAQLGARVLQFPTIRIQPPEDAGGLRDALSDLAGIDWIAFTSVNTVEHVFDALARAGLDSRALAGCSIAAVGSATTAALADRGIKPDLVPARATSVALFDALRSRLDLAGKRFLLPRANIAPPDFPERLRNAGAEAIEVTAYRTVTTRPEKTVLEAFRKHEVDIVTFTSSSTAKNFAAICRRELGAIPADVRYASIGPRTSQTARAEGMTVWTEAEEHTVEGLIAALVAQAESGSI